MSRGADPAKAFDLKPGVFCSHGDRPQDCTEGCAADPGPKPTASPKRLLSMLSSVERKSYPMATGLLDYFPDALALVAHVSWLGNQKHNPGQPLHWARGKSMDHADCQIRHMIERDGKDENGAEHMACKAWRALAELQEFLEQKHGLSLPRSAREA